MNAVMPLDCIFLRDIVGSPKVNKCHEEGLQNTFLQHVRVWKKWLVRPWNIGGDRNGFIVMRNVP